MLLWLKGCFVQNPFLQFWVDYMLKLSHVFVRDFVKNVTYDNRCRGIEKVPCNYISCQCQSLNFAFAD